MPFILIWIVTLSRKKGQEYVHPKKKESSHKCFLFSVNLSYGCRIDDNKIIPNKTMLSHAKLGLILQTNCLNWTVAHWACGRVYFKHCSLWRELTGSSPHIQSPLQKLLANNWCCHYTSRHSRKGKRKLVLGFWFYFFFYHKL